MFYIIQVDMNTIECIKTRKSVRKFTDEEVTDRQINTILECAMAAPSARNSQPWKFVVVKEENNKQKVKDALPFGKYNAPVIIICGIDKTVASDDHSFELALCDLGAVSQNVLLAAHDLGMGAVWCAAYPSKERSQGIIDGLKLENFAPFSVIFVGHEEGCALVKEKFNQDKIITM